MGRGLREASPGPVISWELFDRKCTTSGLGQIAWWGDGGGGRETTDGKATILLSITSQLLALTAQLRPFDILYPSEHSHSGPQHPFMPPLNCWVPLAARGVGTGGAGCKGGVGGAKTHFLSPWGSPCPSPDQALGRARGAQPGPVPYLCIR